MAKVYDNLIKERLEEELLRGHQLSGRQLGFSECRSAVDAIAHAVEKIKEVRDGFCLPVTFNVKNGMW